MSLKLKLFPLANSNANPKLGGPFECSKDDTYAKLEGIHIED